MISFPKAKINLGLRITGKRADGFHDIETVFYPVGLSDALEFVVHPSLRNEDELTVTGFNPGIRFERNLVIRAVRKLREIFPLPFLKIHLHKVIPTGAGLGGGSADAACMLRSVNRRFNLSLSDSELRSYALELGSDCPFFIDPSPSFAIGRGEILSPVKPVLEGYYLVLINPGIHISTREAYLNSFPSKPEKSLEQIISFDVSKWKKLIKNDFEDYAFKVYPQIGDIKKALYKAGALFSSMTGSGSTVYGIFEEKTKVPGKLKDFVIYEGVM
jgi:4-diphosphocytidyl-2-C-methyl-D-erythritol kinase